MFFVRKKPHVLTFAERLDALRQSGFTVENSGSGRARAIKNGCGAMIEERGEALPASAKRA